MRASTVLMGTMDKCNRERAPARGRAHKDREGNYEKFYDFGD